MRFLKFLVFLLLFAAVGWFCHKQTRGFQLCKVHPLHPMDSAEAISLSEEEKEPLRAMLAQPFYFLASGGQCYVFASEDGKVVLKLFKNHHIRFWTFLHSLSLPSFLEVYRKQFLNKRIHQSPEFFESCKIAYLELKDKTGLIYLHLNKTDFFKQKVTLVDKLGIYHRVDLDASDFALQKSADLFKPKMKQWIGQKRLDLAKPCIDSFLDLIAVRCQKGVLDRDPNFGRNVGLIGNQAIEMDIGSYSRQESLKNPESFKREIVDKTQKLKAWLELHSPELSAYLSDRVNHMLQEAPIGADPYPQAHF